MKIREIRAVGLRGATPEGGWSEEIQSDQCVHTLIAVLTDEGVTGYGSVFTNDGLVKSALAVLEPFYKGENALEPERVSEKLHQNTFWLGRGGSLTHTISGIDIACGTFWAKLRGNR
jgi:L-alanine-DL-glutamate epimerase-like enolase superfamily enzyme